MTLTLPEPDHSPSPPAVILAFLRDSIASTCLTRLAAVEDNLHNRLRILREREQPADEIREALALCAERRTQLASDGEARPAHSG